MSSRRARAVVENGADPGYPPSPNLSSADIHTYACSPSDIAGLVFRAVWPHATSGQHNRSSPSLSSDSTISNITQTSALSASIPTRFVQFARLLTDLHSMRSNRGAEGSAMDPVRTVRNTTGGAIISLPASHTRCMLTQGRRPSVGCVDLGRRCRGRSTDTVAFAGQ